MVPEVTVKTSRPTEFTATQATANNAIFRFILYNNIVKVGFQGFHRNITVAQLKYPEVLCHMVIVISKFQISIYNTSIHINHNRYRNWLRHSMLQQR